MDTLYCPTCRTEHETVSDMQPPYATVHIVGTPPTHRHPITGEVLT